MIANKQPSGKKLTKYTLLPMGQLDNDDQDMDMLLDM